MFKMIIRSAEIIIKTLICLYCLFFMLVCYSCWHGGHFPGDEQKTLSRQISFFEDVRVCEIEGKKISKFSESIDEPFLRIFLFGTKGLSWKYHIVYEIDNENENFVTYEFPFTLGIGSIHENTGIIIEEKTDSIVIYYDREPSNGFEIEHNPFSKKVYFEQNSYLYVIKKRDNVCY